jgi:uncharacterized protein YjbI with pentapeptide repeats
MISSQTVQTFFILETMIAVLLMALRFHPLAACTCVSGTCVLWLSLRVNKKVEIARLKWEINQLRNRTSSESARRLAYFIRKLNQIDYTSIDLRNCHLAKADLRGVRLKGADLRGADLEGADLRNANLADAQLQKAHLQDANLTGACLDHASLEETYLSGARLLNASLQKSNLKNTLFDRAILQNADLKEADVDGTFFRGTVLKGVNLTGDQLSKVKTFFKADMDQSLGKQIAEKYPHLLDDPKMHFWKTHMRQISRIVKG